MVVVIFLFMDFFYFALKSNVVVCLKHEFNLYNRPVNNYGYYPPYTRNIQWTHTHSRD